MRRVDADDAVAVPLITCCGINYSVLMRLLCISAADAHRSTGRTAATTSW